MSKQQTTGLLNQIVHRLYCHNPFYVISALLVLLGLYRTFSRQAWEDETLLLTQILCGYATLLALVAWLVIRFGKVWEDARTIILSILLIFAALSVAFDRTCLDNTRLAAKYMGFSFAFCVVVCEWLLFALKIRLGMRYRIPFYLQLFVLFTWPVLLGHFSINGKNTLMSWCVFLFPVIGGMTLLLLWPAAFLAGRNETPNGTPWRWPAFPWPLFFVTTLGWCFRSYSLSMAFEASEGMAAGFRGYFLIPLLLPAALVALEIATQLRKQGWQIVLMLLPLSYLSIAFAGPGSNHVQRQIQSLLAGSIGSPALWTTLLLIVYYGIAYWRSVPLASLLFVAVVMLSSRVVPEIVGFGVRAGVSPLPFVFLSLLFLFQAVSNKSKVRGVLAACFGVEAIRVAGYLHWADEWISYQNGFYSIHFVMIAALLWMQFWPGPKAEWFRLRLPAILIGLAVAAALLYPSMFFKAPYLARLSYQAFLIAIAVILCFRELTVKKFVSAAISSCSLLTTLWEAVWKQVKHTDLGEGFLWWSCGILCLLIAFVISLIKGGSFFSWLNPSSNPLEENDTSG